MTAVKLNADNASGLTPYAKGWRSGWAGGWGPLRDGHSRLAKLARTIERELVQECQPQTALHRRLVRSAAELFALAEKERTCIGLDPKSTIRRANALEKTATARLAAVVRLTQREAPAPLSATALLNEVCDGQ